MAARRATVEREQAYLNSTLSTVTGRSAGKLVSYPAELREAPGETRLGSEAMRRAEAVEPYMPPVLKFPYMLFPLSRWAMAAALLICFLHASPLHAWGPEGHFIVAAIAAEHLRPRAAEEMHRLLGTTPLSAAANWPDRIEGALPATGPWHYVNIPSSAAGYLARRDCPRQDCVVAKIEWFSEILRDREQSPAARLVAMEYLIHLVGDIHQPFHALANARGGNDIPVIFFGSNRCGASACELHYIWDTGLIRHTGLDRRQYVAFLEKMVEHDRLDAAPEDPVTWANQSFQLAKQALVQPGAEIGQSYYDRERPVMDRQLAIAGLRLAALLNQDLDPSPRCCSVPGRDKP